MINTGSRVDDEITNYVNIGGSALRELCVGFRLHYRLSYRLSTFWCFDTITIIIVILSLSTLFWAYRIEMLCVSISNTSFISLGVCVDR